MTRFLLLTFSCLALFNLHCPAFACLWDRDTLASEAKGIPDAIRVITGRFERNPPLYYEMRLKRVTTALRSGSSKLEDYDDAAVACDRLGRSDQAITWMRKKRQQLAQLGQPDAKSREHWYRYYANAGTFWAHQWLRAGANRQKIGEMKKARDLIAAAIRLNPEAHFGREKYQLRTIEWVISPPTLNNQDYELPNLLKEASIYEDAPEAVKGLTGLIVLGNAWESVDIFNALAYAVQHDGNRSSPAYMARLRACELVDQGKKSVIPTAPTGGTLKKLLIGRGNATHYLEEDKIKEVEGIYKNLRSEAESWQSQRTAYMMEKLKAGRHPDTDAEFWKDYREPSPPDLSVTSPVAPSVWLLIAGFAAMVGGILIRLKVRKARLRVASP